MNEAPIITVKPTEIDDAQSTLEDLVERSALDELCQSLFGLFGVPIRVISEAGGVFGVVAHEHDFCAHVGTVAQGRSQCRATVDAVRTSRSDEVTMHPCFTGLAYYIEPFYYEARIYGRVILGPFLPPGVTDVPADAKPVLQTLEEAKTKSLLARVPRAKPETVARISQHLRAALDLILFNAHKAALTSSTHIMSVRESFRELQDKNVKLQSAYEKLREADRLKSSFLATVSHELKTPLTSILGYSEMLTEGIAGQLTPEQTEHVQTIHERGQHLLQMITGLLDLSKLEIGTMQMKREQGKLYELLHEIYSGLLPIAKKKNVTIQFNCTELPLEVRFDKTRIEQVFSNIIENAIKFTPAGGSVTVSNSIVELVEGEDEEDDSGFAVLAAAVKYIETRVSDTGIGIPEGERERVFDAFYQVDSSSTREHGGTGLGLAIAKKIIDAHGGVIKIESNEPTGTTFVIRIPEGKGDRKSIRTVSLFDPSELMNY